MKITADTNLLVRLFTNDDPTQAKAAQSAFAQAELVALPLPALCELVWVLQRGYRLSNAVIATTIRKLISRNNVVVDRPAIDAGLSMIDAGGDFSDGVVAHDGRRLGGAVFVSFDKRAVKLLLSQDKAASLI